MSDPQGHGLPAELFLLGLTAGAHIANGFVFFVTSQVGADGLAWGFAKVLGGIVFSTGLVLVVLTSAELFTSSTLTHWTIFHHLDRPGRSRT